MNTQELIHSIKTYRTALEALNELRDMYKKLSKELQSKKLEIEEAEMEKVRKFILENDLVSKARNRLAREYLYWLRYKTYDQFWNDMYIVLPDYEYVFVPYLGRCALEESFSFDVYKRVKRELGLRSLVVCGDGFFADDVGVGRCVFARVVAADRGRVSDLEEDFRVVMDSVVDDLYGRYREYYDVWVVGAVVRCIISNYIVVRAGIKTPRDILRELISLGLWGLYRQTELALKRCEDAMWVSKARVYDLLRPIISEKVPPLVREIVPGLVGGLVRCGDVREAEVWLVPNLLKLRVVVERDIDRYDACAMVMTVRGYGVVSPVLFSSGWVSGDSVDKLIDRLVTNLLRDVAPHRDLSALAFSLETE